jgi:hypothetical protein
VLADLESGRNKLEAFYAAGEALDSESNNTKRSGSLRNSGHVFAQPS